MIKELKRGASQRCVYQRRDHKDGDDYNLPEGLLVFVAVGPSLHADYGNEDKRDAEQTENADPQAFEIIQFCYACQLENTLTEIGCAGKVENPHVGSPHSTLQSERQLSICMLQNKGGEGTVSFNNAKQ